MPQLLRRSRSVATIFCSIFDFLQKKSLCTGKGILFSLFMSFSKKKKKTVIGLRDRAWYGMEWNGNFGMECGRCQNGMEWKISRMEWKTIFHTNSILDFVHCLYRKIILMSGSDNNIVTEVLNFNIYA